MPRKRSELQALHDYLKKVATEARWQELDIKLQEELQPSMMAMLKEVLAKHQRFFGKDSGFRPDAPDVIRGFIVGYCAGYLAGSENTKRLYPKHVLGRHRKGSNEDVEDRRRVLAEAGQRGRSLGFRDVLNQLAMEGWKISPGPNATRPDKRRNITMGEDLLFDGSDETIKQDLKMLRKKVKPGA